MPHNSLSTLLETFYGTTISEIQQQAPITQFYTPYLHLLRIVLGYVMEGGIQPNETHFQDFLENVKNQGLSGELDAFLRSIAAENSLERQDTHRHVLITRRVFPMMLRVFWTRYFGDGEQQDSSADRNDRALCKSCHQKMKKLAYYHIEMNILRELWHIVQTASRQASPSQQELLMTYVRSKRDKLTQLRDHYALDAFFTTLRRINQDLAHKLIRYYYWRYYYNPGQSMERGQEKMRGSLEALWEWYRAGAGSQQEISTGTPTTDSE